MPYCASFRAGRFDFVVAIAHIYYGKTKAERNQRREEIQQLVDFINRRTKTAKGKVFDRDFFVGDLNIEGAGDPFFDALVSRGFAMPDGMNSLKTNFSRTKTYDKIAWVIVVSSARRAHITSCYSTRRFSRTRHRSADRRKSAIICRYGLNSRSTA